MVKSISPKEILQIARVKRPAHHLHDMERMDLDAVATRLMGSPGNDRAPAGTMGLWGFSRVLQSRVEHFQLYRSSMKGHLIAAN